ncbi:carboxypeptidase regulatory-like domain-containing protein [Nocardioides humilatus]|uniref:Carboxypeptidase regulatory-like domain-containing protein n=1 Tax=Nocardioides humilatus TaxID=2607660 RepID=A0A5B1L720_9ACTN|nr:carboxypeptidase-like regulatory domain-containing protein [Nocardioides humilatus]KAA1416335.1 carboxypeptidase regulatory-like domain-containing protein [Nocardioides humilatus]
MSDPTGPDLLDEQMDRRLREAGTNWRDGLPLPPPVAAPSSNPRRWLVPLTAAAAVAAIGGASFVAISHDNDRATFMPDPAHSGVSPTPCDRGSLEIVGSVVEERRNYRSTTGVIGLKGDQPCTLSGYPKAIPRGTGLDNSLVQYLAPDDPPATVLLTPKSRAVVTARVQLSGLDCLTASIDAVEVTLPNGDAGELAGIGGVCEPGRDAILMIEVLPISAEGAPLLEAAPATVSGTITLDGGPAPGQSIPVTSGEITFDGESSGAGASIDPGGTYEVQLAPGEYDVTVSTPDWNGGQTYSDGKYGVTGGTTATLDIHIPIR